MHVYMCARVHVRIRPCAGCLVCMQACRLHTLRGRARSDHPVLLCHMILHRTMGAKLLPLRTLILEGFLNPLSPHKPTGLCPPEPFLPGWSWAMVRYPFAHPKYKQSRPH